MNGAVYPGRGQQTDWNNVAVIERNRLAAHASLIPFPDTASCRLAVSRHRRFLSTQVLSLRGDWDYRHYPNLLQLPENILSFRSGFEKRQVPEAQLTASHPLDADRLPFPVDPPFVPDEQAVHVYRKTCRLPLTWGRLRKRLVLSGVRAACHAYVNGKAVGFTQGSALPASFDITSHLHDGDNELFLLIYPYSTGSYLEQLPDQPWFGCIRDVYLEAHPSLTIQDLHHKTTWLADEKVWRLDLSVVLLSTRIALEQPTVQISLRRQDQPLHEAAWTVTMKQADPALFPAPVQTTGTLQTSLQIRDVQAWSDEAPVLYDLFCAVSDRTGQDQVCVQQSVGFRDLAHKQKSFLINGRPVRLKPVRWSGLRQPDASRNLNDLVEQIRGYKQHHFNTIWFCHEPPDPIVLDLCDAYGFYVIVDAPLQDQTGWVAALSHKQPKLVEKLAVDRLERLIMRDRNHPCVIAWSCGLFLQADAADAPVRLLRERLIAHVRSLDPVRPIHGADFPDLGRYLDDWLDASQDKTPSSVTWLRLPQAGEDPWCLYDHDLSRDLLPAAAKVLEPLAIEGVSPLSGSFSVINRMHRTSSQGLIFDWSLLRQGIPIRQGTLTDVAIGPGHSHLLDLDYGAVDLSDGCDYLLQWTIRSDDRFFWFRRGDSLVRQEVVVQGQTAPATPETGRGGRLRLESDRHHLIVSGSRFWFVFNRLHATLESWRSGDREWLASRSLTGSDQPFYNRPPLAGLRWSLMRQPDPLDEADWQRWQRAGYDRLMARVVSVDDGCDGKTAVIDMTAHIGPPGQAPLFKLNQRTDVSSSGRLTLFASLSPLVDHPLPPACFGYAFNPAHVLSQLAWYGPGPERSLARLAHSGLYTGHQVASLADLCRPDAEPGVFKRVRQLSLRHPDGPGLMIRSDQPFAFDTYAAQTGQAAAWRRQAGRGEATILLIQPQSLYKTSFQSPIHCLFTFTPLA